MAKTANAVEEKTQENIAQQSNTAPAEEKTQVQSVELSDAAEAETTGSGGSIDILLDIDIPVTVAIGQTTLPIRRLLQLGPGSVVKLDKPVDAPVDLYLKGARFAAGSVVVVDGRFAVRIKQIFNVSDSAVKGADE